MYTEGQWLKGPKGQAEPSATNSYIIEKCSASYYVITKIERNSIVGSEFQESGYQDLYIWDCSQKMANVCARVRIL